MGVYIKGIDMPKEGYCDIVSIHSNGEVCRWFAKQNNVPIAEAIEVKEPLELVGNPEQLRPKGKWEYEKINSYSERTYCSECGSHAPFEYVTDDYYGIHAHGEIRKTNYCPNCGARMKGADMRGEQNE